MEMEARDICRFLLVAICCLILQVESAATNKDDLMKSFTEKCSKGFSLTCMKADFVKFLDKLDNQKDIDLFGGLSLERNDDSKSVMNSEIVSGELL